MVFCIKYRKKILFDNGRVEFFKEICSEIGERYCFEFDAIGTDGDHVHIFVGAALRYAPSRIMQIIKSITVKNIFKKYPDIIKRYVETQGIIEESESCKQMKLLDFK